MGRNHDFQSKIGNLKKIWGFKKNMGFSKKVWGFGAEKKKYGVFEYGVQKP